MINYTQSLTGLIKSNKKVKKVKQLSGEKWTKNCFETLADLIKSDLLDKFKDEEIQTFGCTISYKTLSSIFKDNYKIRYPLDPRTENTLNKISIFLDYPSWNNLSTQLESEYALDFGNYSDEEQVKDVVRNSVDNSFKALLHLNTNGATKLNSFIKEGSSAFNRVAEIVEFNKSNNFSIANNYNPSTAEILDMDIENISDEKAIVKTKEYWLLCWWSSTEGKYMKRFKDFTENQYVVKKQNTGQWMVEKLLSLSDMY